MRGRTRTDRRSGNTGVILCLWEGKVGGGKPNPCKKYQSLKRVKKGWTYGSVKRERSMPLKKSSSTGETDLTRWGEGTGRVGGVET